MKRALLALGLAMASVSVPLTFAKTNNHATRRWTPRPVRPRLTFRHNVKKHGGNTKSVKAAEARWGNQRGRSNAKPELWAELQDC